MKIAALASKFAGSPAAWGLAALGIAAAYVLIVRQTAKTVSDVAGAVGDGASAVAEGIGGVATGHNAITTNTPYDNTGIFGTLGAATNDLLGGAPQAFGEWVSNSVFDWSHSASGTIQSTSGNPYGAKDATYNAAGASSPVNAQYAASPLTSSPVAQW